MTMPQDAYSARFPVYTADPTFATIGAHRPWIRSDVSAPDELRYYLSDGTLAKKSTGLVSEAVRESDNRKIDVFGTCLLMGA